MRIRPCQPEASLGRYEPIRANYGGMMGKQIRTVDGLKIGQPAGVADARISLLTEVAFKWLMAGQGWWIDTTRMYGDPSYAAGFLRLAMASQSVALRECALRLQAQIEGPVS